VKTRIRLIALATLVGILAVPLAYAQGQFTGPLADATGYTSLRSRLGAATPTGTGIVVEQVEAIYPENTNNYLPNSADSSLAGRAIIDMTMGGGVSGHATTVGRNFYGNYSLAPGIHTIDVYEANHWLNAGFLYTGGYVPWPLPSNNPRVINASWVGNNNTAPSNIDTLRRLDYTIERDNTIVVVGVSNNDFGSTDVPALLASSYNSIAVGMSGGGSSIGPTKYAEGIGRSKPDLVAPGDRTSYATPLVAGAAALLLQTANGNSAWSQAANPEAIRALLLAGAAKDAWSDWSHTQARPLDVRYGAGQLNIDRSYQILTAGRRSPSNTSYVPGTGWTFDTFAAGASRPDTRRFFFQVAAGQPVDFSAVLAWDRHVANTGSYFSPVFTSSLATLNLKLYQAGPAFSLFTLLDQSTSTVDNVQDLFERTLAPGQYALQVTRTDSRAEDWDYSLAWQLLPQPQWNGAGAGNNWSEAANWGGAAPVSPQPLKFAARSATGHAANTNDCASGTLFNGITFMSTATAYTLSGNSIKLGGAVANQSAYDQAIGLNMELAAGGGAFDTGAKTLTISGSISGSGQLIKSGSGKLVLSGTGTYTGGTTVSQGVLEFATLGSVPPGGGITILGGGRLVLQSGLQAGVAAGAVASASDYSVHAAPEPGTLALLAAGAAGWFVWRRRRPSRSTG
jgi:autotransporter-associated beta strand protein